MINAGKLDKLCTILHHAPARGSAGEVLVNESPWKEKEKMRLGRVSFNGRTLVSGGRDVADQEVVFEGWQRLSIVRPKDRLLCEGVAYEITRVDPSDGRQWMLVYCTVVS